MKIAIVSSRAIPGSRWGHNLTAGHYLAQVEGRDAAALVEERRERAVRACELLQEAINQQAEAAARQRRLIDNGDIVPWD